MWYRFSNKIPTEQDFSNSFAKLINEANAWISNKENEWISKNPKANRNLARLFAWKFKDLNQAFRNEYGFVRGPGMTGNETNLYTKIEVVPQPKGKPKKYVVFKEDTLETVSKIMKLRAVYFQKWQAFLKELYNQRVQIKNAMPNAKKQNNVASLFKVGKASVYGKDFKDKDDGFEGKVTANGERFNSDAITCAHKTLPFNTYVEFYPYTNDKNEIYDPSKAIVVRVNDRGPYANNADFDLTRAVASKLGMAYEVKDVFYRIVR